MIYWNQKRHYRLLSASEREFYLAEMSPLYMRKLMKWINLALNIAAPLILYFHFHLPLKELAFAFIAFDICLNVFEQIVFITLPWLVSIIPLIPIKQWQYNGISHNLSKIDDRIDVLRKKHCESCDDASFRWETCTRCSSMKALCQKQRALAESKQAAKENLDKLLSKRDGTTPKPVVTTAQPIAVPEQPKSENTLVAYFQKLSFECNKIISTHRFDFLISVRKNADALSSILKSKPEGETEIPGTLCYRLDNLVKLLHNLSAESDEVRTVYFEDAKAASNALAEEMQQIISAINKMVPGVDMNTPEILLNKTKMTKENNHV